MSGTLTHSLTHMSPQDTLCVPGDDSIEVTAVVPYNRHASARGTWVPGVQALTPDEPPEWSFR